MFFTQWLVGADNLMKIRVHEFVNYINIIEIIRLRRPDDVPNGNHLHRKFQISKFTETAQVKTTVPQLVPASLTNVKAPTFSWSICSKSLISRRVRLASVLLSNAFAIFFIATSSPVSVLRAELQEVETASNRHQLADSYAGLGAIKGDDSTYCHGTPKLKDFVLQTDDIYGPGVIMMQGRLKLKFWSMYLLVTHYTLPCYSFSEQKDAKSLILSSRQ